MSFHGLARAREGFVRRNLLDFIKAILREKEIEKEREQVRAIGHTSGQDILLGVLSLLKICLEKENEMAIKTIIKKNTYFDSVSLMALSTKANGVEGVKQVNIAMGTSMNKDVLKNTGLLQKEAEEAKPGDLMIVIESEEGYDPEELLVKVEEVMQRKEVQGEEKDLTYSSVEAAVKHHKDAKVAVISVPGAYAARVAKKAIREGLHVMMFSDNVTLEEEIELKKEAHEKGLLVMGPDCGTAILNGKGLCFANEVRRGSIGIVAASGNRRTGSQRSYP